MRPGKERVDVTFQRPRYPSLMLASLMLDSALVAKQFYRPPGRFASRGNRTEFRSRCFVGAWEVLGACGASAAEQARHPEAQGYFASDCELYTLAISTVLVLYIVSVFHPRQVRPMLRTICFSSFYARHSQEDVQDDRVPRKACRRRMRT